MRRAGISGAALLVAEDGEIDAGALQDGRHGAGDALAPLFERRRASDPEEHLRRRVLGESRHVEALGPVGAGVCRPAPGVAALLHAHEGVHARLGDLRSLHREVAAHVHDQVDVLDADGALLHARPAGQAVPEGLLPDPRAYEGFSVVWLAVAVGDAGSDFEEVLLEVLGNVHGREGLAADIGGAGLRAASTDGAGVAVEKLLLREVAHVRRAEDLCRLEVEWSGERSRRFEGAKHEREGRADEVYVFGHGDVDGKSQDYADVRPP